MPNLSLKIVYIILGSSCQEVKDNPQKWLLIKIDNFHNFRI